MLSVIIPCHNEAAHIGGMIVRTEEALRHIPHEVLIVADGCTDGSADIARGLIAVHPTVRLIENADRLGKGGAIRRGVLAAAGDTIAFIDGDGEIDPSFIRVAYDTLGTRNADIVIGNRYAPTGGYHTTFLRRLTSRTYQALNRLLFGLAVRDTQAGMKLFKGDIARALFGAMTIEGYAFDIDILSRAHRRGYNILDIPMTQRFKGTSKVTVRHALRMILDTSAVFWSAKK